MGSSTLGNPNYSLYNPPNSPNEVPVKGSPLLFDSTWARAKVIAANNDIIQSDSIFYNFDKLSQTLIITQDFKKIYTVDKREFKSVTFFWHDSIYVFEHVYDINKNDFFMELVREEKGYSVFKWFHTSIRPANFRSNGISSDGILYDEYVDEPVYYVFFPNREYRQLNEISKKAIERIFQLQVGEEKADRYLATHTVTQPAEDFLVSFINFMNE
jgi:hypothetical protein